MTSFDKIFYVDCRHKALRHTQPLTQDAILLGARALTADIIAREVPPTCHPLGPKNKLVLACGPLAGTLASSVNRLSIGAKSPLTGGIKESNAGGTSAYMMGRLGIRALVLEDMPEKPHMWSVLYVSTAGVRFDEGTAYTGLGVYGKAKALYAHYGTHVGITCIGPTGEMRLHAAGITNADPDNAPTRFNGRGGLGAVMGSKGICAIIWDTKDAPKTPYADQIAFNAAVKELATALNTNPQTAEVYRKYGTAAVMDITQKLGALPTRNFSQGCFDKKDAINGKALHDTILARGGEGRISHACMRGCVIQCSNIFPDATGKNICSPLEYENLGMLGSNLDIGDLDAIARLNWLCNDLGCDTIEMGAALGVAMAAGMLPFGDAKAVEKILDDVRHGTPLGRILASGAGVTGTVFGCRHVPAVKNQAMAAYDPRGIKGLGITYATSPQGADHTAGITIRANIDHHGTQGQKDASHASQTVCATLDALGCCLFIGAALGDWSIMCKLLHAKTGMEVSFDALKEHGKATLHMEKDFNHRAGLNAVSDRLPEYMYLEKNPDCGQAFDIADADMVPVS